MKSEKLYTTEEAAKKLGISRQWFWELCLKRKIKPVRKYGKSGVYTLAQLESLK